MDKLYKKDLNMYKQWFKEASDILGIDVKYRYVINRKTETATGESIYSKLSEPINISIIIESGILKVDSLKQLGWFVDTNDEELLVDFDIDTPNLQEGCRIIFESKIYDKNSEQQNKQYIVKKLSTIQIYPSCIKCLCTPVMENLSNIDDFSDIEYNQQSIISDEENYSFINEEPNITMF